MTRTTAKVSAGAAPYLHGLNDAQRAAVMADAPRVAVLAGPGTGKTRVIIHRVARILAPPDEGGFGAEPESVLALAFTIKSAEQLRRRLADLVGPRIAERVNAQTCHAFGARLVRRFGDMIGLPPVTRIMDSAERRRLLREIVREHDLFRDRAASGREGAADHAWRFISQCHGEDITPRRAAGWLREESARLDSNAEGLDSEALDGQHALLDGRRQIVQLFELLEPRRLERGLLTFDDYITLPIRILRESPAAAAILRDELRHIVVDEFQDWSPAQIEMLTLLARGAEAIPGRRERLGEVERAQTARSLVVVGDDDQAIFGFRGADDRAFERFSAHWPGHVTVPLSRNYRSAPEVVAVAASVMSRAERRFCPDKAIEADPNWESPDAAPLAPASRRRGSAEGITVEDEHLTGAVIASMILSDQASSGRAWSSYAVIARTHSVVDGIQAELELQGIPVDRRRRATPLGDQGVQDLLAWARLIVDPSERPLAIRLLVRPPLSVPVERARAWDDQHRAAQRSGEPRPFPEWLAIHHARDAAAVRFASTLSRLRALAATATAEEVFSEIVHDCDVVHHDALDPRGRALRVVNVVKALKFVQSCAPVLPPPGDLAAFLAHYDDLDDDEQEFEVRGDERLDSAAEDDGPLPEAVSALSAHQAKGLEFDTVFVARVRPPHGFPTTGRENDQPDPLPTSLIGREERNALDEERRLFYVACSRAGRRLVLLAKARRGSTTTSTDYFRELMSPGPGAEGPLPVRGGEEVLREQPLPAGTPSDGDAAASVGLDSRKSLLRRLALAERRSAASALHAAEAESATAEQVTRAGEALRSAASRLAAISRLRAGQNASDLLDGDAAQAAAVGALLDRLAAGEASPPTLFRPLRPPLDLSYTKIEDYRRCPRCYYVKHILGLAEPKTSGLSIGAAVHAALQRFQEERRSAEADGRPLPALDRLIALGGASLRAERPRPRESDRDAAEQVEAQLRLYWDRLHDESAEVLEVEQSVRFPYEVDGAAHRFTAKIDRVDRLSGEDAGLWGARFRIVDFKTGEAWKKLTEPKPDDLQLCIYAMALQSLFSLDEPARGVAEYWITSSGDRGSIDLKDLRIDRARAKIDKAVRGMIAGQFPRNKDDCKGLCEILGDDA